MKFNIDKKLLTILSITLFVLYSFLTFINVFWTTYVDSNKNDYHEYADIKTDNIFFTVLFLIGIFLILFLFEKKYGISKIYTRKLQIFATIFIFAIGVLWIFMAKTHPVHDQSIVSNAASEFIDGNFAQLNPGEYLQRCTHQLGIVWIFQLIYSVVGKNSYTFIMLLNVLMLCGIYNILFKILKRFTLSSRIHNLYWILAVFNFSPIFYCTFVYGTFIGLFFAVFAIYLLLSFIDHKNYFSFAGSFLFFALSCIAKSNYKIYVIAAIILLLYKAFQNRKLFFVPFAFIIAFSMFVPSFVNMYYASASSKEIGKGSPSSLWVAMGLQEGPCGSGWYNMYVANVYGSVGGDYEKANEIAKKDISKYLLAFKEKPLYAANFFFEKTLSQWNDPSFQSIWMCCYWDNYDEDISPATESIYHGGLNKFFLGFMDIITLLIWAGNALFYFIKRKELTIEQLIFGIIFFGGFLFHLFWEAKALYTMPFFMLSLPSGVWGIDFMLEKFQKGFTSILKKYRK